MLKRNSQFCQHSVPDFAGRLTDSEFLAYNSVFNSIENDFKEFSAVAEGVAAVEASQPRLLDAFSLPAESMPEMIEGQDGTQWRVVAPLLRARGMEVVACKRSVEEREEFAIVERFDPNSPLARAQGACDVQMTGADAGALLKDFTEGQREALRLYADDIVAVAQERGAEKYSGQDLARVVKAISQRCTARIVAAQTVVPIQSQKQNEGMRV